MRLFNFFLHGDTYTREKQFPVVVACRGTVNGQTGEWSRELYSLDGRTTRQNASWIEGIASTLDTLVRAGEPQVLPVISYYGTGRALASKASEID